jgi:hypothetical protein
MDFDNKSKAYGTLIAFAIIAGLFWYYSDAFSNWAMQSNPLLAMVASLLLNPSYLFLIFFLFKQYSYRGIAAGLLISFALDIVSLGHSVLKTGELPMDAVSYTYSDTTIYKLIYPAMHNQFAVFFLYVIVPVLLVYLSLRVIRRTSSFNKLTKSVI